MSPLQQGVVVHRVLQRIWQQLQSLTALKALSDEQISALIEQHSQAVLLEWVQQQPGLSTSLSLSVEPQRLQALLQRWLALEAQRPDFALAHVEQSLSYCLAGLTLRLTVDRIDQLADGSWYVIDYKTGEAHNADWMNPAPVDAQLPLYGMALGQSVRSLAYAQLKADSLQFKGLSDTSASGLPLWSTSRQQATCELESLSALKQHWHLHLTEQTQRLQRGEAQLRLDDPALCQRCPYPRLCRRSEAIKVQAG